MFSVFQWTNLVAQTSLPMGIIGRSMIYLPSDVGYCYNNTVSFGSNAFRKVMQLLDCITFCCKGNILSVTNLSNAHYNAF
jgi:hypothetical protein